MELLDRPLLRIRYGRNSENELLGKAERLTGTNFKQNAQVETSLSGMLSGHIKEIS